jgi:hypothetical protein
MVRTGEGLGPDRQGRIAWRGKDDVEPGVPVEGPGPGTALMRKKACPEVPETVLRSTERSPLFWLLYRHHAQLAQRWDVQRVDWKAVCAWAETQRAWDKTGRVPKPGTAQKTWQRVCQLHARERATREARQRPSHARSPAISQAPPVAASWPTPPNRSHPAEAQGAGQAEDSDLERRMALTRAMINRRSGRPA